MKIIQKETNPSGAYPSVQTGASEIYEGFALWPDTLDDADFYSYNGFVVLGIESIDGVDTVVNYTPNVEAWEAWQASLPETEPEAEPDETLEQRVTALENAIKEGLSL